MDNIREDVIYWYLDKTYFDFTEHLTKQQKDEYLRLSKIVDDDCPFCGYPFEGEECCKCE